MMGQRTGTSIQKLCDKRRLLDGVLKLHVDTGIYQMIVVLLYL